jgi:hypothetical protein
MDDLDKKLEEIWKGSSPDNGAYKQIKQAFIEDGWVKIITGECTHPDFKKRNCRLNHECEYCVFCGEERHMSASEQDSHDKSVPTMTGQEWYERFLEEYLQVYRDNRDKSGDFIAGQAVLAAKKASGIK